MFHLARAYEMQLENINMETQTVCYTSRVRIGCNQHGTHEERNHRGFTSLVRIRMQRGVGLFPLCGQPVSPLAFI